MSVSTVPVEQRPLRHRPACEARRPENRQLIPVRPGQSGRPRQRACGSSQISEKADQQDCAGQALPPPLRADGTSAENARGSLKGPQ